MRSSLRLFLAIIVLASCLLLLCAGAFMALKMLSIPPVGKVTSPLDALVVKDLCGKLDLTPSERGRLCRPEAKLYSTDFFPAIKRMFPNGATYEEVEAAFGTYRYDCDNPVKYQGELIFYCYYDLKGDRVFHFECVFTIDGKLRWINANRGGY